MAYNEINDYWIENSSFIRHENDTNPFRYCGEYYDEETESIYIRARNYDPGTGRFTSEAPARDGLNWYVYCGNNPVMFKNPSGKVPVETFADFMSAGYSAVDFFTSPLWEKAGYLVWDTFSVFIPYIPGSYSAKGFNYVTRITEESINDVSECIAKNASKIESAINNITDEIVKSQSTKILNNSIKTYARNLAKKYNLTEKVFKNHILAKHGADVNSKVKNASKFIDGVDVKYAIDTALKNPNSKVLKNTDNRKGYIFKYTFDYAIGKDKDGNKVNTIKVVLGENANVITAYPVK